MEEDYTMSICGGLESKVYVSYRTACLEYV